VFHPNRNLLMALLMFEILQKGDFLVENADCAAIK